MASSKPFFIGDFSERANSNYRVGNDVVYIAPFEMIVPLAITPVTDRDDQDDLDLFPAKIDPGFSHNFHISLRHLESAGWANSSPDRFLPNGQDVNYTFANGAPEKFDLYDADLWIPTQAGQPPQHLRLDGGFSICDRVTKKGDAIPKLPLLGQRALAEAELRLEIDYKSMTFRLWRP